MGERNETNIYIYCIKNAYPYKPLQLLPSLCILVADSTYCLISFFIEKKEEEKEEGENPYIYKNK